MNLKLPVLLTMLLVSAIVLAGDWNPVGSRDMSVQDCDPFMCPPGCCSAECFVPCNTSMGWERSKWQDVRYDQKGHLKREMSKRQALNIAQQYLEKYHIDAELEFVESDEATYKLEVFRTDNKYAKMLDINRKNGWVRQIDGC
ncbi:MAG: hypothetical protein IPP40_14715 [bacterium]|nr:hypothetical protein [bacterium]